MQRWFGRIPLLCFVVVLSLAGNLWGKDAGNLQLEDDLLVRPEGEIDLATAALAIAQGVEEDFEGVAFYAGHLAEMVSALKGRIGKKAPEEVMAVVGAYLFGELGFQYQEGLEKDSLLVLPCRKGNGLGLSALYLALAERLGLPLFGVYVPEHCLVRYDDGENIFYIETGNRENFPLPEGNGFYLRNLGKECPRFGEPPKIRFR